MGVVSVLGLLSVVGWGCGGSQPIGDTATTPEAQTQGVVEAQSADEPEPAAAEEPPPVPRYSLAEPETRAQGTLQTLGAPAQWSGPRVPLAPRAVALRPFTSRAAVRRFAVVPARRRRRARTAAPALFDSMTTGGMGSPSSMSSSHAGPLAGLGSAQSGAAPSPSSPGATEESITSQQVTGIDEGDIVKSLGEHLVVLRRGVLHSVSLSGAPAVRDSVLVQEEGEGDGWIDEILVHPRSRRIIVTGFVVGPDDKEYTLYRFYRLTAEGRFQRGDAMYVPSSDYYDEEGYATRIHGDRLVAYSLHEFRFEAMDPGDLEGLSGAERQQEREAMAWDRGLPAMRTSFDRPLRATWTPRRIYRPIGHHPEMLHVITTCELMSARPRCSSRGVPGGYEAELFVTHSAAYLLLGEDPYAVPPAEDASDTEWDRAEALEGLHPLYRFPMPGGAVTSTAVLGRSVGPLGFVEADGVLRVLTVDDGELLESWRPEPNEGELNGDLGQQNSPEANVALHSIPVRDFGRRLARREQVRALPGVSAEYVRFVGDQLLYVDEDGVLYLHDLTSGTTRSGSLRVGAQGQIHPIANTGALVAWPAEDGQHYSLVQLSTPPRITEHRLIPRVASSETRTHGFFYRPDAQGGSFGMPLIVRDSGARSMLAFFDVRGFQTRLGGHLVSSDADEGRCAGSCYDWYGNSRPIFWRDRIFALLGPELIEGHRIDGRVTEKNRLVLRAPEEAEAGAGNHPDPDPAMDIDDLLGD